MCSIRRTPASVVLARRAGHDERVIVGSLLHLPADDWSAIASWLTAATALTAGGVAYFQLGEARRLRREQAQPYVVVYLEDTPGGKNLVDLVVENFGATAAYNVIVTIAPTPERSNFEGEYREVKVPDFPVLVPRQRWRNLWDAGPSRADSGLPDRHTARVTAKDSQGKQLATLEYVLDWSTRRDRMSMTTYGEDDVAKALIEISEAVQRWGEGHAARGLAVTVRNGDAKDDRAREQPDDIRKKGRLLKPAPSGDAETTD